jgi:hypothetical protein
MQLVGHVWLEVAQLVTRQRVTVETRYSRELNFLIMTIAHAGG